MVETCSLSAVVRADTSTRSLVLTPEGQLTPATAPKLINTLARGSTLQGTENIHVDLSQLTVLDPRAYALLDAYVSGRHDESPLITVDSPGRGPGEAATPPLHPARGDDLVDA